MDRMYCIRGGKNFNFEIFILWNQGVIRRVNAIANIHVFVSLFTYIPLFIGCAFLYFLIIYNLLFFRKPQL